MKNLYLLIFLTCFLGPIALWGQPETGPPSAAEREQMREQFLLDRLLSLPPDQLTKIRETLEKIEKMSEDEREAMQARVRDFRRLDQEKRQRMLKQWRAQRQPHRKPESIPATKPPGPQMGRGKTNPPPPLPLTAEQRERFEPLVSNLSEEEMRALRLFITERLRAGRTSKGN